MIIAYDVTGNATVLSWRNRNGESGRIERREPKATAALLPAIQQLLEEGGEALECLAVMRGPGSFSGIRVGLSTAAGLRVALNIPVFAFSKFEIMAFLIGEKDGTLLLPAHAEHVFCAPLRLGRVVESYRLCLSVEFASADDCYGTLPIAGTRITPLQPEFTDVCLDLLEQGRYGAQADPLEPLYIRPPDAKINLTFLQKLRNAVHAGDDN